MYIYTNIHIQITHTHYIAIVVDVIYIRELLYTNVLEFVTHFIILLIDERALLIVYSAALYATGHSLQVRQKQFALSYIRKVR